MGITGRSQEAGVALARIEDELRAVRGPFFARTRRARRFEQLSASLDDYCSGDIVAALSPIGGGRFPFVEDAMRRTRFARGTCPDCRIGEEIVQRSKSEIPEHYDEGTGGPFAMGPGGGQGHEFVPALTVYYKVLRCSGQCRRCDAIEVTSDDYERLADLTNYRGELP